jgi:23S rRNA G2069 N7-methylase RlmK/C1962 C5-methylase RlmI
MATEARARSRRWLSDRDADVDAYLLSDGRWFLFAYIRDRRLALDDAHWSRVAAKFADGEVLGIGRALKTDEGSEPLAPLALGASGLPEELWAREGWLRFRLETKDVLNPGLFLDQELNRERLMELAQGASPEEGCLNLFSYTGAFTMSAFCAGARSGTSVDVSARYLAWERANAEANFGGLELTHKLIKDDARDFLRRAARKAKEGGARYRWIIVDPPTFSRGQGKPFKVERDLVPMLADAADCLAPRGAILASTNDARWATRDFVDAVGRFARERGLKVEKGRVPPEFGAEHPLKSAWLHGSS